MHLGSKEFLRQFFVLGSCNFTNVSCCSTVNVCFNFLNITEAESYLFISDSLGLSLLPLDVEYFSDRAVVEGLQLVFVFHG